MRSVLITGGTGAFGKAFARHLLDDIRVQRIVIYSRGEFNQFLMSELLHDFDVHEKLRFMIGDVRDRDRLRRALEDVDVVVHAAALKRIETGHYNPTEMVKTNIGGTINVIEATKDAGVKKVVFLSSDKAYRPVSPYGQTKALAESLFIEGNNIRGWLGPKFSVCRYGNVWNSTGSVVPVWKKILGSGEVSVPVTDPECTRFFMRMDQCIDLVLHTIEIMQGGELQIPVLPAYRLADLAAAMNAKMRITGLPDWEKQHEGMEDGNTSDAARRMTIEELRSEL